MKMNLKIDEIDCGRCGIPFKPRRENHIYCCKVCLDGRKGKNLSSSMARKKGCFHKYNYYGYMLDNDGYVDVCELCGDVVVTTNKFL